MLIAGKALGLFSETLLLLVFLLHILSYARPTPCCETPAPAVFVFPVLLLAPSIPTLPRDLWGSAGAQPTPPSLETLGVFSSALAVILECGAGGELQGRERNPKSPNSLWSAEKGETFPAELVL